jgi:hypothetical protein
MTLQNDAPISGVDDDAFARLPIAQRMALEAQLAPPDSGYVLALSGPWGSGKTSITGMVAEIVRREPANHVVIFNPWMFSSGDDLVARFLAELAAVLGQHDRGKVARKVADYASSVAGLASFFPIIGTPASAALAAAEKVRAAAGEGPTLEARRHDLAAALAEITGRIVVFIDDIDRLSDQEVHDVVRLVKLVGDLPRVTYVLCFDTDRVAEILGRDAPDAAQAVRRGHDFLEKIVQSQHRVPPLRPGVLTDYLIRQVNAALPSGQPVSVNTADWVNLLALAVTPMLRTPRDAKRIANAMPAACELLGDEIAIVDLFGLECLRVLEPEVHGRLPEIAGVLVNEGVFLGLSKKHDEEVEERFEQVLAEGRNPVAMRRLLGQLFPAARPLGDVARGRRDWKVERRERRVSRAEVFGTYLHTSLDERQLAAAEIEALAKLTAEPSRLAQVLASIPDVQLRDAIGRLNDFSNDFDAERASEAAGVLLDLYSRIEQPFTAMTGVASADMVLRWAIGAFLRAAGGPDERAAAALALHKSRTDLTSRLQTLAWFRTTTEQDGREPDPELDLIPASESERLWAALVADVIAAEPAALAGEAMFGWLLDITLAAEPEGARDAMREKATDDAFMTALLHSYNRVTARQSLTEAAIHSWHVFERDQIADLLGDELLRARIDSLREELPADLLESIGRAEGQLP